MSEPSNGSLQGMITSLGTSTKSVVGKSGVRQEGSSEDGQAFARTLDQAMGGQSVTDSPVAGNTVARTGVQEGIVPKLPPAEAMSALAADMESQERSVSPLPLADEQPLVASSDVDMSESIDASVMRSTIVEGTETSTPLPVELPAVAAAMPEEPVQSDSTLAVSGVDEEAAAPETKAAVVDTAVGRELPAGNGTVANAAATITAAVGPADSVHAGTAADTLGKRSATLVGESLPGATPASGLTASPTAGVASGNASPDATVSATTNNAPPIATVTATSATVAANTASPVVAVPEASVPLAANTASSPAAVPTTPTSVVAATETPVAVAGQSHSTAGDEIIGPAATNAGNSSAQTPVQQSRSATTAALGSAVGTADVTVSETLASAPVSRSTPAPAVEVGEVISQAALAVRYRHAGNDTAGRDSGSTPGDADTALTSIGVAARTVTTTQAGVEAGQTGNPLTASTIATKDEVAPGSPQEAEVGMNHAELLKGLQTQRAALSESLPLQGTTGVAAESLVKATTPDNMFLPVSGGIVTAPVVQRADAAPVLAGSAPFELPLLAEDADVAMASNVKWMAREGVQNATVTVSPAGMGPITVKVGIEQDHMSVSIAASQHVTREALDAMLPRLRDQLTGQGYENVKLDVSDGRGEQDRSGNGQMFAGMRNPSDTWTSGGQRNSANNGNQSDFEHSSASASRSDEHMAEDLQRVPQSAAGGSETPSVFDAYV